MLSRCPACATVFRVDTVQIRAREGRVRCGRCNAVFDALDSMVEIPVPRPATTPAATPAAAADIAAPPVPEQSRASLNVVDAPAADVHVAAGLGGDLFHVEAADATPDLSSHSIADSYTDSPPLPRPGDSMSALVERTTGYWGARSPSADAAGETAGTEPEPEPENLNDAATAAGFDGDPDVTQPLDVAELPAAVEADAAPLPSPPAEQAGAPLSDPPPALEAVRDPAVQRIRRELYGDEAPERRSRVGTALWSIGALLLALLAAAQLAYHFRTDIALAQPALKPLLERACASLGCSVPAPRQPEQVSIESSELTPEAGREPMLRLSALLRNRAPFAQAWPHLELTLTDTSDRAVVRRVLAPAEFLPTGGRSADFAAESEQSVSLLIDPADSGASGYRLYAFYP